MSIANQHGPVGPLLAGFAGALALTALHETARRIVPNPPRMDTLGRRALARGLRLVGSEPPPRGELQAVTLTGDVLSNGLMYAAAVGFGSPESALVRGAAVGAVAGLGAVLLPPVMGLGPGPAGQPIETRLMTVAWYTFGGVVAAEVYRRLRPAAPPGAWLMGKG